jgi:flagellar motor switch protein FliM
MSQDFLSQEEVDALLKGVSGEVDEAPSEEESGGVKAYDLGRQERIVRGRMPTMELINERFARYFRIGLFNFMHRSTEISVGPVRVQKYSDFIRNLVVPTNLNLVQMKPLRGTGLVVFDPNLVFLVVDNMFGSDGRFHTRVEGRDFTPTEQRIITGMLNVVFAEYEKAWKPVYEIEFEYVRSEMNTQFANIATPSEIVVAFTFTIELSGNSAEMHICLPYSMIEPIRDVLYSTMHSEQAGNDLRWTGMLRRQLLLAEVELVAPLGDRQITLGEVAKLKVGDIVHVDVSDLVTVKVDGIPLLNCRYGINNGQYALKIDQFVAPEETID